MRALGKYLLLIVIGALVLSPIIIYAADYLELDPFPGDIPVRFQNIHFTFPLVYSLGASAVLSLFYWVMKR
jgi:hypothetical protein